MTKSVPFFSLFVLLLLSSVSCQKDDATKEVRGCRDTASVNYNPSATVDDGSCKYPADVLEGNYTYADTIVYTGTYGQGTYTIVRSGTFSVTKTGPTSISVISFGDCPLAVTFNAGKTSLAVLSASSCGGLRNFTGVVRGSGAKISYSYAYSDPGGQGPLRGTGTKQP